MGEGSEAERVWTYAVGLGSNRWSRWGDPRATLDAAVGALAAEDMDVLARSPTLATPAMGGAGRRFANAVVLVETDLTPPELLAVAQAIERAFGRRPGRRWGPRVLDLDILLWSGGLHREPEIPHPGLSERSFALRPLAALAPGWRDPRSGLTVRQLLARLRAR